LRDPSPLGNLRQHSFREIWYSEEAQELRRGIRDKECWCTNEIFLWSSINYQPRQLAKAMLAAKVWQKAEPLADTEKLKIFPEAPQRSSPELKALQNSPKTV
jgi:hypothetical protein